MCARAALLVGGPHLPHGAPGQLGFAGLLLTFPLAQLALLTAVDRAGPVVTAVAMNLEPLITIGLAVILLGEHVSAVQLGGAALVVAAIAIMRRQVAARSSTTSGSVSMAGKNGAPRPRLPVR